MWILEELWAILLWHAIYKRRFQKGHVINIQTEGSIFLYKVDIKRHWPKRGNHACFLVEEIIDHSDEFPEPYLVRHYMGKFKSWEALIEYIERLEEEFQKPLQRYNSFEEQFSDIELKVIRSEFSRRWVNLLIF